MVANTLLEKIFASARISELMAWPLDFEVMGQIDDRWFQTRPKVTRQAIAQDGTGGIFALYGSGTDENRPILFVSSEGQAGLIAETLAEALQLIIALPYWRDCLKFSGGGSLGEMQRVVAYLEQELREDEPDIDGLREELFNSLGLTPSINVLDKLHRCLLSNSSRVQVLSADGSEFLDLFGGFIVENNPSWSDMH